MKVFIKNKLISLGGSLEVFNEQKEIIYKIKGKIISPTRKKKMYDKNRNLLYTIRNKFWHFFVNKVFVYDANNNKIATLVKNKFSINKNFEIQTETGLIEIKGEFFKRNSQILKDGVQIGIVHDDFNFIADTFTLEAEEQDIPFLVALVVALDNLRDKAREN